MDAYTILRVCARKVTPNTEAWAYLTRAAGHLTAAMCKDMVMGFDCERRIYESNKRAVVD